MTRRFVDLVNNSGIRILDTRKTTPLFRDMEKYAVRVGGGLNHRRHLREQVIIKDNHLALLTGGSPILEALRRAGAADVGRVIIEVEDLAGLQAAATHGAEIIIYDNAPPEKLREASAWLREKFGASPKRPLLEASGGINLENVKQYAAAGVDRISVGGIIHSAPVLNLSLEIHPVTGA
jgi:nicotinate-nucleotide pyrophosphorylase (carboxylating)